jgi:hypothetical protein
MDVVNSGAIERANGGFRETVQRLGQTLEGQVGKTAEISNQDGDFKCIVRSWGGKFSPHCVPVDK